MDFVHPQWWKFPVCRGTWNTSGIRRRLATKRSCQSVPGIGSSQENMMPQVLDSRSKCDATSTRSTSSKEFAFCVGFVYRELQTLTCKWCCSSFRVFIWLPATRQNGHQRAMTPKYHVKAVNCHSNVSNPGRDCYILVRVSKSWCFLWVHYNIDITYLTWA